MSEMLHLIPDQLSALLDDRLKEEDKRTAEAHLKTCSSCARQYQGLVQLRKTLLASAVLTPPESFYQGVRSRIIHRPARGSWFWGIPAKTLASACLVMLVVLITRQTRKKKEQVPEKASHEQSGYVLKDRVVATKAAPMRLAPQEAGRFGALDEKGRGAASPAMVGQSAYPLRWEGISCGITEPLTVIAQTLEEWTDIWNAHYQRAGTPPGVPPINFNVHIVVGVYAGEKPSSGYSIKIIGTRQTADALEVLYRETSPAPGMAPAMVLTQPFHLLTLPKNTLPIRFKKL